MHHLVTLVLLHALWGHRHHHPVLLHPPRTVMHQPFHPPRNVA